MLSTVFTKLLTSWTHHHVIGYCQKHSTQKFSKNGFISILIFYGYEVLVQQHKHDQSHFHNWINFLFFIYLVLKFLYHRSNYLVALVSTYPSHEVAKRFLEHGSVNRLRSKAQTKRWSAIHTQVGSTEQERARGTLLPFAQNYPCDHSHAHVTRLSGRPYPDPHLSGAWRVPRAVYFHMRAAACAR